MAITTIDTFPGKHNRIAYGDADAVVAGGSEMATTPLSIAGFSNAKALSKRNDQPTLASRPWDAERDGFVLSDGAGKLTLSDLNEEGANLLALQTRQQLGIQALAFAGQSEQAILGLFR